MSYMSILMKKKNMSYVSKVNKKNTLFKENNNKIPYVSEVIKFSKKKKKKKKKGLGTYVVCCMHGQRILRYPLGTF